MGIIVKVICFNSGARNELDIEPIVASKKTTSSQFRKLGIDMLEII
jgi:hypothetical protein